MYFLLSIMDRLRIKKKKIEVLVISVSIESLLYITLSQTKGIFQYPLKRQLTQKVHAQLYSTLLFSSITITQLLSACLKS